VSTKPRRRRKLSAREAMHAKRAKAPEINPCPPGATGGQYKPLTDNDIQQIYSTALRVLSQIGMAEAPDALIQQALSKGATQNEAGRLCFSPAMVEDTESFPCMGGIPDTILKSVAIRFTTALVEQQYKPWTSIRIVIERQH